MKSTPLRGLFFTSIPKAGKNLIYSFLNELGYGRPAIPREGAVWSAERPMLAASGRRCTYALPPPAEDAATIDGQASRFADQVATLGDRQVVHHHVPFSAGLASRLAAAGVPVVFVYRDPRDVLLSMADYILNQGSPAHLAGRFAGRSRAELVQVLWAGDDLLVPLAAYIDAFDGWRTDPRTVSVRFEDLIGERGGGTAEIQSAALRRIAGQLGAVTPAALARAQAKTFNPKAGTFFKGQAGRWREETEPAVRAVLHANQMMELATRWGYPAK
ncbi:MAG TPA: sulfotransferase domain-containing protein [Opitutaceae bacterium]|nr:sulfotransferase domain-containing protein [Opitutaceae bacterium]